MLIFHKIKRACNCRISKDDDYNLDSPELQDFTVSKLRATKHGFTNNGFDASPSLVKVSLPPSKPVNRTSALAYNLIKFRSTILFFKNWQDYEIAVFKITNYCIFCFMTLLEAKRYWNYKEKPLSKIKDQKCLILQPKYFRFILILVKNDWFFDTKYLLLPIIMLRPAFTSQQREGRNNVWSLFNINNENVRAMTMVSLWCP